jgi:hypothetical protein
MRCRWRLAREPGRRLECAPMLRLRDSGIGLPVRHTWGCTELLMLRSGCRQCLHRPWCLEGWPDADSPTTGPAATYACAERGLRPPGGCCSCGRRLGVFGGCCRRCGIQACPATYLASCTGLIHMHNDALAKAFLQLCAWLQWHPVRQAAERHHATALIQQLCVSPRVRQESVQELAVSRVLVPNSGEGHAVAEYHSVRSRCCLG